MWVFTSLARQVGTGHVKHDAYDLVGYPRVVDWLMPCFSKLLRGMYRVIFPIWMVLVIADTWIERDIAQLCRQVFFCQPIVFGRTGINDIAGANTKGRCTFI